MRRQGAMRRQGMCRHNASSGGPGSSPMCRHNASSASAPNVRPKLRVPWKKDLSGSLFPKVLGFQNLFASSDKKELGARCSMLTALLADACLLPLLPLVKLIMT